MYANKNKISLNNMYGIYIIIIFVIISILGNLYIFNDDENIHNIKIIDKYLPPSNFIIFFWVFLLSILAYLDSKINIKKDKFYITRLYLIIYLTLCVAYGMIIENKSLRFIKNYNYIIFIMTFLLYYIINKNTKINNLYMLPIFLWLGYIAFLTLLDDLNIIELYKDQ